MPLVRPIYPNVTLVSGGLSAVVFLPGAPDAYYRSSRFDHGTMIGDVRFRDSLIFGSNFWRAPHDPEWTESGVGLASEFGCGEDGHLCGPGWGSVADNTSSNGVLGYFEASNGEPFLKIGVGALIKGSCPACGPLGGDTTYKFNSPYRFHQPPRWRRTHLNKSAVSMEHAAELQTASGRPGSKRVGYRVERTISLHGASTLRMETRLHNTGEAAFRTPFYSHNFFSVDGEAVGPPLELKLDLNHSAYKDCLPWAAPLQSYFDETDGTVTWLRARRRVPSPTRIKAIFVGPAGHSNILSEGRWQARYPGRVSVAVTQSGPLPLYGYSLYVEERTLSPEPVQMLHVAPGQSIRISRTMVLHPSPLVPERHAERSTAATAATARSKRWWRAAAAHAGFLSA